MKRLQIVLEILVLVGLIALWVGAVQRIHPQPVNAVLGDQSFVDTFGQQPDAHTPESLRIRTHLCYVERQLRQRDVAQLTPAQRTQRQQLLDHLRTYAEVGRFPANYDHPDQRRPCFIDKTGAICAVGYLIEQSAGRALAERINARHQYDYITDMHLPDLARWVAQSGLTLTECAMIQPSYVKPGPPIYQTDNSLSRSYAVGSGVLNAANLALGVLNVRQLRAGTESSVVPLLGLATGLGTVALGVLNRPRGYTFQHSVFSDGGTQVVGVNPFVGESSDLYVQNPTRNAVSWVNIGVGTASVALSTWNLLHHKPKRTVARTQYGFAPLPGDGGVVQVAHTF